LSLPCEDNGPAGPNEFKFQSCGWTYELAPAETNTGEDFTALWVQMEIDPGPECAQMMLFRMKVPKNARVVSGVPDRTGRIRRASAPTTTELVVDGDGAAPLPGTVAQDVAMSSGRAYVEISEREYRYFWIGNASEKVNLAIGVQIAHEVSLDEWFASWSEQVGAGGGTCSGAIFTPPHRGRGRS
jgi:hypothetical protein